jgi:hypothetical protein
MNEQSTRRIQLRGASRDAPPQDACQPRDKVDIRLLKTLIFAQFPRDSIIYDIFVTEHDLLSVSEFLAKVDVWLRLLRRIKS